MKDDQDMQCQILIEKGDHLIETGDIYNAVKLFRKAVKLYPQIALGFERLSNVYHFRNEWKPAFHFAKKALAINSTNKNIWWILGVSAERLNKPRIAKSVWQKFGFSQSLFQNSPVAIKTIHDNITEILLARSINPTVAEIINIPHPDNSLKFGDTILFDRLQSQESVVISKMKLPIYPIKEKIKTAHYLTFSTTLFTNDADAISILEKLAASANIGFEIWSNISLFHSKSKEFYVHKAELPAQSTVVAFASKSKSQVMDLLNDWTLITLKKFSDLICHHESI